MAEFYEGTSPILFDTDNDTYRDGQELALGVNPLESDMRPRVLGSSPVDGSPRVARDADIIVYMDRALDAQSLSGSTIPVTGTLGGNTRTIPCAYSFDSAKLELTISPQQDFLAGKEITVTLTTNVRGTGGVPLARPSQLVILLGQSQIFFMRNHWRLALEGISKAV